MPGKTLDPGPSRHGQEQKRKRQDGSYPQPSAHVEKLDVGLVLPAGGPGFQCHATDGTCPGFAPDDFRMHRTGEIACRADDLGPLRGQSDLRQGLGEVGFGLGAEAFYAVSAAEEVFLAGVSVLACRRSRIDRHPAHGILHLLAMLAIVCLFHGFRNPFGVRKLACAFDSRQQAAAKGPNLQATGQ